MSVLTYVEELERKTIAFCEDAALRHQQGVYSDRELALVMNAAWQCTGGLVDQMTEIMGHVADMKLDMTVRKLAVPAPAEPHVINIERDGCTVKVRTSKNPAGTPHEYGSESLAVTATNDAAKRLAEKGYLLP